MTTIRAKNSNPWTQVREVKIAHRSIESVQEVLRIAADRLQEYMGDDIDEGTVSLITELDQMRKDVH